MHGEGCLPCRVSPCSLSLHFLILARRHVLSFTVRLGRTTNVWPSLHLISRQVCHVYLKDEESKILIVELVALKTTTGEITVT
jgi:hypothetical protein